MTSQVSMKKAWLFALFNGLSFQIVLGSPMILYAQKLHASATVLGIITGLTPLMVIFQLPAAHHVDRVGYKRFMMAGWGTRTLFTLGMALLPWATLWLSETVRLVLLLGLLFCFNLVRGISSCAWLPWITHLVPENYRGRYVSREAAMSNLGSFLTIMVAAICLGKSPQPWQFSLLFAFSAIMGMVSLMYLNRVPDIPTAEKMLTSGQPVPWLAILRHPPFKKLLQFVSLWSLAYGGFATFTVAFLKTEAGLIDAKILLLTSFAFLGGLSSLWLLGHRLDHVGSKPILLLSLIAWLVIILFWIALAGRLLSVHLAAIIFLQFFMGLFAALVTMANNRLAMAIIPIMGRTHFFVLYSVFANVTLGLSPILWGVIIDLIGTRHGSFLGLEWTQYTIFFALVLLTFVGALLLAGKLHEPKSASLEALLTEIMIQSPQRLWLRIWST